MQLFDCRMCKTKNPWRSIGAHFEDGATSMSFAFLAITPTNAFTPEGHDDGALWLSHVEDPKSLMLCWHSHYTHWNRLCTHNYCIQWIANSLLTSNIAFLSIIICIQKPCGLWISDQPLSTWAEWEMMWPYHIPALSAANLWHVDHFTSFWLI